MSLLPSLQREQCEAALEMVKRCVLTAKDGVHLSHGEEGGHHHDVRGVRARASCERILFHSRGDHKITFGSAPSKDRREHHR